MLTTKLLVACFLCLASLFDISLWIFFEIISSQIQNNLNKIGLPLTLFDFLTIGRSFKL